MMQIKLIKAANFKRALIITAIFAFIAAFINFLPISQSVHALSSDDNKEYRESIYKMIIDRTIPMIGSVMNSEQDKITSEFIAYTFFKYIIRVDFENPKTYLLSEIPLLGLVDITTLNADVGGVTSNNNTIDSSSISQENNTKSNFDNKPVNAVKVDSEKPAVIIYHTHTTESFNPTAQFNYEAMGDHRTTDRNFNVCRLGEEIKSYIEAYYGLAVVHDMTLHDYPYYEGSYNRSKPTVENLIKKYPDAKLIIDLHRDAFDDDEAAKKLMTAQVRGEQAAKTMFVIGKSNPHWQENYYTSLRLNQKIEELYPGLSRGIRVADKSIYNQDISNKSVLIEVGADCNTLEETIVSAKMVARAIGQMLKGN